MDPVENAKGFFPILRRGGSHRLSSGSELQVFCGFLTLLFLVRITVNLCLLTVYGTARTPLAMDEIGSVHLLLCTAFLVWIGTINAYRISLAVPEDSFLALDPLHGKFMRRFMAYIVTRSPLMPAIWLFMVYATAAGSVLNGHSPFLILRLVFCFLGTAGGTFISLRILEKTRPRRIELDILEALLLLFLAGINPDMLNRNGTVRILLMGSFPSWYSDSWVFFLAAAAALVLGFWALIFLVSARNLGFMAAGRERRKPGTSRAINPLTGWYARILTPRLWLTVYLLALPFLVSSEIARRGRMTTFVVFVAFAFFSFLIVVMRMDRELSDMWHAQLMGKRNLRLLAKPLLIHILFMSPGIVFAAVRIVT